jgi:hypothetical protein
MMKEGGRPVQHKNAAATGPCLGKQWILAQALKALKTQQQQKTLM